MDFCGQRQTLRTAVLQNFTGSWVERVEQIHLPHLRETLNNTEKPANGCPLG